MNLPAAPAAGDFPSEKGARTTAYRVYVEDEQRTSGGKDPPLLEHPDVVPRKTITLIRSQQTRRDLRRVALFELGGGEVGGDDGGKAIHEAGVDDLIEGGDDELGGHFGAEVVDDEKVAGKIFARGIGAFGAAGKFCGFKVRKEMNGGVVDDGIAAVGDGTRDAGGKEGLSEADGRTG